MPFKVLVGPQQISMHQGQTVLISEPDGEINWPSEKGPYSRVSGMKAQRIATAVSATVAEIRLHAGLALCHQPDLCRVSSRRRF